MPLPPRHAPLRLGERPVGQFEHASHDRSEKSGRPQSFSVFDRFERGERCAPGRNVAGKNGAPQPGQPDEGAGQCGRAVIVEHGQERVQRPPGVVQTAGIGLEHCRLHAPA